MKIFYYGTFFMNISLHHLQLIVALTSKRSFAKAGLKNRSESSRLTDPNGRWYQRFLESISCREGNSLAVKRCDGFALCCLTVRLPESAFRNRHR